MGDAFEPLKGWFASKGEVALKGETVSWKPLDPPGKSMSCPYGGMPLDGFRDGVELNAR